MPAFTDEFSMLPLDRVSSHTLSSVGHGSLYRSGVTSNNSGVRDDVPIQAAFNGSRMLTSERATRRALGEEESTYEAQYEATTWRLDHLEMPLRINGGAETTKALSMRQRASEVDEADATDLYISLSPPPFLLLRSLEEELSKSSADVAHLKTRMARFCRQRGETAGTQEGGRENGDGRLCFSPRNERMQAVGSPATMRPPGRSRPPPKEVVEGTPGAVLVHKICQRCSQSFQGPKQVINPRFAAHARYCKREREKADGEYGSSPRSKLPRTADDAPDTPKDTLAPPPPAPPSQDLPSPDRPIAQLESGALSPHRCLSKSAKKLLFDDVAEEVECHLLSPEGGTGVNATLEAHSDGPMGEREARMLDDTFGGRQKAASPAPIPRPPPPFPHCPPCMGAEQGGKGGGSSALHTCGEVDSAISDGRIHAWQGGGGAETAAFWRNSEDGSGSEDQDVTPTNGTDPPHSFLGGGGMGASAVEVGIMIVGLNEGRKYRSPTPLDVVGAEASGKPVRSPVISPLVPQSPTLPEAPWDILTEDSGNLESTSQTSRLMADSQPHPTHSYRTNLVTSPSQSPVSAKVRRESRIGKKSVENAVLKFQHSDSDPELSVRVGLGVR